MARDNPELRVFDTASGKEISKHAFKELREGCKSKHYTPTFKHVTIVPDSSDLVVEYCKSIYVIDGEQLSIKKAFPEQFPPPTKSELQREPRSLSPEYPRFPPPWDREIHETTAVPEAKLILVTQFDNPSPNRPDRLWVYVFDFTRWELKARWSIEARK